jgi:PAS domain-containing protein
MGMMILPYIMAIPAYIMTFQAFTTTIPPTGSMRFPLPLVSCPLFLDSPLHFHDGIADNHRWKSKGPSSMKKAYPSKAEVTSQLRELSAALEHAVEGIARLDTSGRYVTVNKPYAETLGYQPDELIGMEWQRTAHPDDLATSEATYADASGWKG